MDEWLTYQQAGQRHGVSAQAIRQRAIRGNWQRRLSNEGVALVRLPDGVIIRPKNKREHPVELSNEQVKQNSVDPVSERLIAALEAHIATLQAELSFAREELLVERQAALQAIKDYQRIAAELAALKTGQATTITPLSDVAEKRVSSIVDIMQRMKAKANVA